MLPPGPAHLGTPRSDRVHVHEDTARVHPQHDRGHEAEHEKAEHCAEGDEGGVGREPLGSTLQRGAEVADVGRPVAGTDRPVAAPTAARAPATAERSAALVEEGQ